MIARTLLLPLLGRLRAPSAFWRSLLRGSRGLGRSYAAGAWDCDDLVSLVRIAAREVPRLDLLRAPLVPLRNRLTRVPRNTRAGARRHIAAHYNLGNELFALFLDETMTYSCGIFENGDTSLREAQEAKLDLVCRKLELEPDDHLVEIGSGWGSLAIHAAGNYGCRVTTTTLPWSEGGFRERRIQDVQVLFAKPARRGSRARVEREKAASG
jgi:cyclopropane-fatty-acyl-phospholipid synthase